MKGVEFRRFRMEDTEGLLALWRDGGIAAREEHPRRTIQKKMNHSPEAFWVAVSDGRVVGSVIAGYDGVRGWLYRLAVSTGYRRRGIGRALVERAEAWLRELGCAKVKLQIEPGDAAAVEFYRKLGYEVQQLVDMSRWLASEQA
jgi:ribosomal protein S18 acetylase RimI-like enzyme